MSSTTPSFVFQMSTNKKVLIPTSVFSDLLADNKCCSSVECFVAYAKQAYKRSAVFNAATLLQSSESKKNKRQKTTTTTKKQQGGLLEVDFTYDMTRLHIFVKLKAFDNQYNLLHEMLLRGTIDMHQILQNLSKSNALQKALQEYNLPSSSSSASPAFLVKKSPGVAIV